MHITLNWESIVTAGAVMSAAVLLWKYLNGSMNYFNMPKENKEEIEKLSQHHEADMHEQREEMTLLTYGILACLKGLKEKGCNGPVTEAINKIEKHLNEKAHEP